MVWVISGSLLLHQWKYMQPLSLSLSNLLIECLYGLQNVSARWLRKEIKMENNMYIQKEWSQIWCKLQLFYNLPKNVSKPSVFACIIDIHHLFADTKTLMDWNCNLNVFICFYLLFFLNLVLLLFPNSFTVYVLIVMTLTLM